MLGKCSAYKAGIRVISAAGFKADDDLQGLALVEGARLFGAFRLSRNEKPSDD